jgi:RNA polymerase sigma factor (sigma-70 family)
VSPSRGARREGAALDVEHEHRVALDGAAREEVVVGDGAAPIDAAGRKRAAVETFAQHEASLRRTARRYSICADDADEALQRGLEILLHKAPSADPRELARWTHTVVKHEALAVRADRERILAGPAATTAEPGREDWVSLLPTDADGPAEQAERHEAIERSREALATLKPQELRALTLLAEGYSYREISRITGYSATKVSLKLFSASCRRLPASLATTSVLVTGSIHQPSPIRSRFARPCAGPLWSRKQSKTRIRAARTASTPAASVT